MDFIFMLTRQDQTVSDCLSVMAEIQPVGLKHVGFKDIGADLETLRALNCMIKETRATSYMEVVSTTEEAALNSARIALEIGVDRLLGGTQVKPILDILRGSSVGYYPFPGRPKGHPTVLGGSPADVEADCRNFIAQGCAGVDLLAYRATEAGPVGAGSRGAARFEPDREIDLRGGGGQPGRIAALRDAGCDAFTIGSAAFDGSFSPRKGSLRSQLTDILACV